MRIPLTSGWWTSKNRSPIKGMQMFGLPRGRLQPSGFPIDIQHPGVKSTLVWSKRMKFVQSKGRRFISVFWASFGSLVGVWDYCRLRTQIAVRQRARCRCTCGTRRRRPPHGSDGLVTLDPKGNHTCHGQSTDSFTLGLEVS